MSFTFLALLACEVEETGSYRRFNAKDTLTVQVGVEERLEPQEIELHSNTGSVVIGHATVDPGGGPSGTVHTLLVEIEEDYASSVDKVTVWAESGPDQGPEGYELRGADEYTLDVDYAQSNLFWLELQSVAMNSELRDDQWEIRLWQWSEEAQSEDSGDL